MADLQSWAALAEILGAVTIIGGAIFGIAQLREHQRQRRQAAGISFVSQWMGPEEANALDTVYSLPDAISADELRARGPETVAAANMVYMRMENLGLLVFNDMMTIESANDIAGGTVRVAWRKLRPWILAKRETSGSQRPGEWFEWIHERLGALRLRDEKEPAVRAHAARRF